MKYGETYDDYRIEGNDLIRIRTFVDETNDVMHQEVSIVMNKWAFVMCFERWIIGERKAQLDQERRREELAKEDREWKEKLARDIEEIHKNLMKGGADDGK